MTQLLSPPVPPSNDDEKTVYKVLLHNISWGTYSALLNEIGDGSTRLTYNNGLLEIEVPSRLQEMIKKLVSAMIEAFLDHLGVEYAPSGSTTWRRVADLQGLEADECYHIQHAFEVRGVTKLNLSVDPPPPISRSKLMSVPRASTSWQSTVG